MPYFLYVKNLVTLDSISIVTELFNNAGIPVKKISFGQIKLEKEPDKNNLIKLEKLLELHGFSLISANGEKIVSGIKSVLLELVEKKEFRSKINLSVYLSNSMNYEYHYLSTLFSDLENISIEKYFIKLKIEEAKKLIGIGDLKFTEIAAYLGYSSPAHFTNQFKKVIGVSPTEYKMKLTLLTNQKSK